MDDFLGFLVVFVIAATVGFAVMAIFWIFVGAFLIMAVLGLIAKISELRQRRRPLPLDEDEVVPKRRLRQNRRDLGGSV